MTTNFGDLSVAMYNLKNNFPLEEKKQVFEDVVVPYLEEYTGVYAIDEQHQKTITRFFCDAMARFSPIKEWAQENAKKYVLDHDGFDEKMKTNVFATAGLVASYITTWRSAGQSNPPKNEDIEFFDSLIEDYPDIAEKGMVRLLNMTSFIRPKRNTANLVKEIKENGQVMTGYIHPLSFTAQGHDLLSDYKKAQKRQLSHNLA